MSYIKQQWVDYPDTSSPLTAERLNHMEDGIEEAWNHGGGGGAGETLPIGSEIDFDGNVSDIPDGWEQVDDVPVYSTSETVCGTWIDGKLIYRKCFEVPKSQMSNQRATIALTNASEIINLRGMVYRTDNVWFTIPKAIDVPEWNCYFGDSTRSSIMVNFGSSLYNAISKIYVIVEYTKTS